LAIAPPVLSAGAVELVSAVVLVSAVEVLIVELVKSGALTDADEWTDECDVVALCETIDESVEFIGYAEVEGRIELYKELEHGVVVGVGTSG
jgi:hypothetical protein